MNVTEYVSEQPGTQNESMLDIDTIRRRVAKIKAGWSEEMVAARAEEGARRRSELESLILELLTDVAASEECCDLREHGFSLVG